MTRRVFTKGDQEAFAALSGDFNPVHIDELAARRLLFGGLVVHGIHLMLWALEECIREASGWVRIDKLSVVFKRPALVGEELFREVTRSGDGAAEATVRGELSECLLLKVQWRSGEQARAVPDGIFEREPPCESSLATLRVANGSLPLVLPRAAAHELFPEIARVLDPEQLAFCLATTRLVGMRCPGLHSIYSELRLSAAGEDSGELRWAVRSCHQRLSMFTIDVSGATLQGTVKAFLRPAPRRQASYAEIRAHVGAQEFTGQTAFVVGGSRGLGEVTAKLLAAGGATVIVTYHRGRAEAEAIAAEICHGGGYAIAHPWNVLQPGELPANCKPSHLYYFATPPLGTPSGQFSRRRFEEFLDHYVYAFLATVQRLAEAGTLQAVLVPSSVSIEEVPPGMAEYAAAKAAGEVAARWLEQTSPGLYVLAPRLPRMATDLTASILPVRVADPVPLLLGYLRRIAQVRSQFTNHGP